MLPVLRLMMFRVANSGKALTSSFKTKDRPCTIFNVLSLSLAVAVYIARVRRN